MMAGLKSALPYLLPLGLTLVAIGTFFIFFGLLWDWLRRWRRGDTHPRCPKCWYNMTGRTSLTCPECGRTAKSEKRLLRARRHWGRIIFGGLLVVLGIPLTMVRGYLQTDWVPG